MNSDNQPDESLEQQFQNPLSFLNEVKHELSQEANELEQIYQICISSLPIIDHFYTHREHCFSGGMKKIEQAWDESASRKIALASPLSEDISIKDTMVFLNEARISSSLEHPNIIPVYQVGRNNQGLPMFSMKWLEGLTLEKVLLDTNGSHHLEELLTIMIKVCEAIEYAHANHVIHLDLKPGNIQLGDFGEVLVLDWGLARLNTIKHLNGEELKIHNSLELFLNSRLRGTPSYISPEYQSGNPLSTSMDIYSLGVMLHDIYKYLEKNHSPTNLSSLKSIANKATSTQVLDRYDSVNQLKKDLVDFQLGYAVAAENPSLLKLFKLFFKRNQAVCISILLSFIILAVSSLIFIINIQSSRAAETEALKRLEQENSLKTTLLEKLSVLVNEEQNNYQKSLNFKEAIRNLEYLTELDSKNPHVWHQLSRLMIGTLNFESASIYLNKVKSLNPPNSLRVSILSQLIDKYAHVEEWDEYLYLNFYKDSKLEYLQASICSTIYPSMRREDQIIFFEKAVSLKNKSPFQMKVHFEDDLLEVDFSYNKKGLNFSAAAGLLIHKLNLSHTEDCLLKFFQASNLKSLDISNTDINDLQNISTLLELKASNLSSSELIAKKELWNNLHRLNLAGNHFESWKFLGKCTNLKDLDLSNTNIAFENIKLPNQIKTLTLSQETTLPGRLLKQLDKRGTQIIFK